MSVVFFGFLIGLFVTLVLLVSWSHIIGQFGSAVKVYFVA